MQELNVVYISSVYVKNLLKESKKWLRSQKTI